MSVQVTLTFANVADMVAHFAGQPVTHIKTTTEIAAAPVEKPKATKAPTPAATTASPAPTRPTAEVAEAAAPEKTVAESSPTADSAQAEPQASTAATDAPAPSYKDAAEAVTKLSRAKGRDAAVAVLKAFGADKLPDVKPEDFAAVIKACADAMGV